MKVPTIRYYEQMGLISAPLRSEGNQRRYDSHGLQRLSFIRHSRELGFSIDDIRALIALNQHPQTPCGDAHEIAIRHLKDVRSRISRLRRLEQELKRLSQCDADTVEDCAILESLADHGLCSNEH